ncbi:Hsp20/alpha crystallin family protein [Bacillus songklensis]|uniref:Hsp20/alpha crystallin family protein n=1 Tax=Bacillus songklensis TaxID=1069116 RepID=A0ABV8AZ70_9BACI
MKKQPSQLDWSSVHKKVEDILGDQFWKDIQKMMPARYPNCDLYETETTGVVVVELPGLQTAKDITIKLQGDHLIIEGTAPYVYPVEAKELKLKERFRGPFSRSIRLPFQYSEDQSISARYKNGLLEIEIPKQHETTPISITFDE